MPQGMRSGSPTVGIAVSPTPSLAGFFMAVGDTTQREARKQRQDRPEKERERKKRWYCEIQQAALAVQ
jgi:hypothetical protein